MSQTIISNETLPLGKGVSTPSRDGEGNYLKKDGEVYVPAINKQTVKPETLNQLTDNGLNTRKIFENDINTLLNQAGLGTATTGKVPGIASATKGGNNSEAIPNSLTSDTNLNSQVLPESRLIGQQLWNFKVDFYNHQQLKYGLAPHAIKVLMIEHDFLSWPLRGYIIVDNRLEGFEKSPDINGYYHIRSDSRDEVFIQIWPTVDPKYGVLPDDIWKITTHCNIYDVEDLPSDNVTTKIKKLYFWDKRFQMLQEKTIAWSTATGQRRSWFGNSESPKEPIAHVTDVERSMFTGDAIASLIIEAGYEKIIDTENWDIGVSKINYTARADSNIWENIEYILNTHLSKEKQDICQLMWNRATEKLQLIPMHKLFEKAGKKAPGDLQIEHFFFEAYSWNGPNAPITVSPWKAPYLETVDRKKDIKSSDFNAILTYRFSQTSGLDNSKTFLTKPIYSHWHNRKQFQVEVQENEITVVKEFFKTNYVDKLLFRTNYPVMTLNRTKKEELAIQPVFVPFSTLESHSDRFMRSKFGKGSTLFGGIFLNQCLTVRVQGSTHRLAGTFVGVDKIGEDSDNNYDYQLCGQYFVVNVKHIIQNQKYVNELILVKVHAYETLQNNEDVY